MAREDRDKDIQKETGVDHAPDDHPSRSEFGRRAMGDMESGRAIGLDKEAAEDLGRPDVLEFSIDLCRCDDGWTARCISVADPRITRKATSGTPAQALAEIARQINRYVYRQARHRPGSDAEPTIPPISISADER